MPTPDRGPGSEVFTAADWRTVGAALPLSGRELEIVQLIFDDFGETGIAYRLGIKESTVHTHIQRIYRKLNVHNHAQLVLRIMDEHRHLPDPPPAGEIDEG